MEPTTSGGSVFFKPAPFVFEGREELLPDELELLLSDVLTPVLSSTFLSTACSRALLAFSFNFLRNWAFVETGIQNKHPKKSTKMKCFINGIFCLIRTEKIKE